MSILTKLKGYRTVLFNVASAVGGVLWGDEAVEAVANLGLGLDSAEKALLVAWAAVNVLLRLVTTTPVGQKTN
jgi:hypothetical protein